MRTIGTPSLWLNDISVAGFGLTASPPDGWADGMGPSDQTAPVPGRAGVVRLGTQGPGTRTFTVAGLFLADTEAEAHTLWDALLSHLGGAADVDVRFAAYADRIARARYRGIAWQRQRGFAHGAHALLTFEMLNPYKQARSVDVYTLPNGVAVPLTLGSAPSDVGLDLIGLGLDDPAVIYRDAQGSQRGDLSFVIPLVIGGLVTGTWIGVDGEYGLPYLTVSAVVTNASYLLSDSYQDFVADPADRDATTGPTLTAVNCNAVAFVRRAWY